MTRAVAFTILAMTVAGCGGETSRPFNWSIGTLTIEGTDYHAVLITELKADGDYVVGGFVSDASLGEVAIGPNNSQGAPLQIIPTQGVLVDHGKKYTLSDDGHLIWIIAGKTVHQKLVGFPLERDLKKPDGLPDKASGGDVQ